jgi:hypothetical protein
MWTLHRSCVIAQSIVFTVELGTYYLQKQVTASFVKGQHKTRPHGRRDKDKKELADLNLSVFAVKK